MPKFASGRYAAIDVGTVTCRLLIADIDANGIHEVAHGLGISNLGEGVAATGYLSQVAMERTAQLITGFRDVILSHINKDNPHIEVVAVATSAARDAKNGEEFLSLLKKVGIEPQIIEGTKEAELSFLGVSNEFKNVNLLVVDVGGGSTELSVGEHERGLGLSQSIDVGCRRVTDRFFRNDPPQKQELEQARRWVSQKCSAFFKKLKETESRFDEIIAVAGTATSVVSVSQNMATYERSIVHQSIVSEDTLNEVYGRLVKMPLDERKQVIGLEPQRAPVIVAGLLILQELLVLSGSSSFTVSESDMLHGIILDASQNRED